MKHENMSESLKQAKEFLGKKVAIVIDRPLGSHHPKYGFLYPINYGYIPNTLAPDGEEVDAYFIGYDKPLETAVGDCIAIIHRFDDDDDSIVIAPEGRQFNDEEINKAVIFQEQFFTYKIIR